MAWTKSTSGKNGEFLVATETIALGKGAPVTRYGSEIDFIPPGADFIIIANSGSTTTSGSCHLRVYVSPTSGGTFYLLNQNIPDSTAARALAGNLRVYKWDASVEGVAPYYKLAVYHTKAESSKKTITNTIILRKSQANLVSNGTGY